MYNHMFVLIMTFLCETLCCQQVFPWTQHMTHTLLVPSFRWCISGYQCKWREAQTLVWLPQKQGQENRALAHVDQWITWFIKWLKTHILSSNLLAPVPPWLYQIGLLPSFSYLLPALLLWIFLMLAKSDLLHLFWEYRSPQQGSTENI